MVRPYFVILILLTNCGGKNGEPCRPYATVYIKNLDELYNSNLNNPVFTSTEPIQIQSYQYVSNGKEHTMIGDSLIFQGFILDYSPCAIFNWLGSQSSTPMIQFNNPGKGLVVAAIFKAGIKSDGNKITNDYDVVWAWHSGLPAQVGQQVSIDFKDGRPVIDNEIVDAGTPNPLEKDSVYFFAAWSWDSLAVKINRASRPIPFVVGDFDDIPASGESAPIFSLTGVWSTATVTDTSNLVISDFPLKKMTIKANDRCPGNSGVLYYNNNATSFNIQWGNSPTFYFDQFTISDINFTCLYLSATCDFQNKKYNILFKRV